MLIRIFSPTECELIRDADLKKCGLNRMTTVLHICLHSQIWHNLLEDDRHIFLWMIRTVATNKNSLKRKKKQHC